MQKRYRILVLLIIFSLSIYSQNDSTIWISGNVVEASTSAPVPYANIASYTQHILFAADSTGHFYIRLPQHDSIKIVVMGYEMKVFKLDSMPQDDEAKMIFPIKRTSIMLDNVDIKLKRSYFDSVGMANRENLMENLHLPGDIKPYDKSKDIIPASYKPIFKHRPPPIAFFFHPISYVSYFTSKREKSKRKMVERLKAERKDTINYRMLISNVSGLTGDSLEKFIMYCNKNIKIKPKESVFDIQKKIVFAFEDFLKNGE